MVNFRINASSDETNAIEPEVIENQEIEIKNTIQILKTYICNDTSKIVGDYLRYPKHLIVLKYMFTKNFDISNWKVFNIYKYNVHTCRKDIYSGFKLNKNGTISPIILKTLLNKFLGGNDYYGLSISNNGQLWVPVCIICNTSSNGDRCNNCGIKNFKTVKFLCDVRYHLTINYFNNLNEYNRKYHEVIDCKVYQALDQDEKDKFEKIHAKNIIKLAKSYINKKRLVEFTRYKK